MEKDLADGIKNLSQSLNKHEVKYMFVGGVAISFYGSARPSSNLPKDMIMISTYGIWPQMRALSSL